MEGKTGVSGALRLFQDKLLLKNCNNALGVELLRAASEENKHKWEGGSLTGLVVVQGDGRDPKVILIFVVGVFL